MAETTPAVRNSDLYSIVVAGSMNPSIHHPYWYRQNGLISQEELDAAISAEDTICLPPAAHFRISAIDLECILSRWELKTTDSQLLDRLLDIAAKVFGILEHTPVVAIGINLNSRRQVSVPDVSRI